MSRYDEYLTNDADDDRVETALVQRVLSFHPTRVTTEELIRDLAGEDPDFGERDSIELAIRELTGSGVLHRSADGFVTPTVPTLRLDSLLYG